MSDESPDTEVESAAPEKLGILGRVRKRPKRYGAIFAGGGLLLLGAGIAFALLGGDDAAVDVTSDSLLEQLENGNITDAKEDAIRLAKAGGLSDEEQGVIAYTIGRSLIDEAGDEYDASQRQALNMIAARYFQEASAKGLPNSHRAEESFYLGKSLYHSGLKTQSLPALVKASELADDSRFDAEINQMLADIYLSDPALSLEQGLEHSEQFLASADLSPEQHQQGRLQKSDLLTAIERFDEADSLLSELLDELPAESLLVFDTQLRLGKLAIAQHRRWSADADLLQDVELRRKAEEALRSAITHFEIASRGEDTGATSRYFLGICDLQLGNLSRASDRFGMVRRELVESPLSIPAALGEAEAIQKMGDTELAFKSFLHLLELANQMNYQDTDWMSSEQFEDRVIESQLRFRRDGRYDLALELAKRMWPPIARDLAMQLQAETYTEWGQAIEDGTSTAPDADMIADPVAAREKYREAALAYFKLSKLRLSSPNYLDYLWNSAEHYFKGRDYEKAVELYQQYLDEPPEQREARAYLRIGESMLAQGSPDAALEALNRCISFFPNDSDSYRARLLAAKVLVGRNRPQEAKQHLLYNIEESALEPESEVWRDSLFALGKMVYHQGLLLEIESRQAGVDSEDPRRIDEGLSKLEEARELFRETSIWLAEAVTRYRDDPESTEARYLLAESYRQAAKFPQKRLKVVTISGTRYQLERQVNEELSQAYSLFDELELSLTKTQDERILNDVEKRILRNCSIAKADILFDQQDYPAAVDAYLTVSNRYHNRPISLEAFCRTASCYRRMNQHDKARGILKQAMVFLEERIPQDADFQSTTRYSRDEWIQILDWLSTL